MAPNTFAYFSLIAWPLVALYFYLTRPVALATIWTIMTGQLLLPVGTFFKFPMIPQFDRVSIPNICALLGYLIFATRAPRPRVRIGPAEVLVVLCILGPLVTSLLNGDPIKVGTTVLPGVGAYDGISAVILQTIMLIPFFLGRRFLRRDKDSQQMFYVWTISGFAYSALLLFEIRFSPQLHYWVYGYYPSDFIQEMRGPDSFRPMAFMGHGLVACFFAMTATVACAVLWRVRVRVVKSVPPGALTAYLAAVLILCKSGAAMIYGMALLPMVGWARPRFQMHVAVILVSIALTYPVLRMYDVFPTNTIVAIARTFNEDRASSLQYRFDQEGQLLERASQRFLFGWGRYGRNRILIEDWRGIGGDSSVTDGLWVIVLGQFGLIGFAAQFGLIAFSVFWAAKALKFAESFADSLFLSAQALIIAVNMIDLLPNSDLSPWTWLVVGSLLGRAETLLARSRNRKMQTNSSMRLQKSAA